MKKSILPLIALLLLAAAACSRRPQTLYPENEVTAAFDSLFEKLFITGESDPGALVMLMRDGEIAYSRGFGMSRLDIDEPITDSTLLNISSATKTFVTAALLKLDENGRLSLDSTIAHFFPEFEAPFFRRITLRHVLTHTSGLPDTRPRTEEEWEKYKSLTKTPYSQLSDYTRYASGPELSQFFHTLDSLTSEPGTRFAYQDAPYLLIPQIIERVTGIPFKKYLADSITAPAGLRLTGYIDPDRMSASTAHGYTPARGERRKGVFRSSDGRWDEYDYGESPYFLSSADKGLFSTGKEFLKWQQALYSGKIISPESLEGAISPLVNTEFRSISYGLGVYVQHKPGLPVKPFHSTSNGGFAIFEGVFPSENIFYLIFANRPDWNRLETAAKVDSILLANGWIHQI